MCGIAGFFEKKADWSEAGEARRVLARMRDTLTHRGPDAEGIFVEREAALGLGHRRLSIIDLSSGAQPMQEGPLTVVFNGEIYNFHALRAELESSGYSFRTSSDTEILLVGYRAWGLTRLLERLNGMFAFALYDRASGALHLARDAIGEKPLYYAAKPGFFAFASEPKALLEHPRVSRATSIDRAQRFLSHDYTPTTESIWSDLEKLGPGCWLTFKLAREELTRGRFYEPERALKKEPNSLSASQIIDESGRLIEDSVKLRLISDVPLGIFLSGGIDSSLVLAAAARVADARSINTFSVSFEERDYDESPYARLMAKHIGATHHEHVFSPAEMLDAIPSILSSMDEPFGDASLFPTYFLCKAARKSITVALSGDGGDELFAGYDTFKAIRLKSMVDLAPSTLVRAGDRLATLFPPSNRHFSLEFKVRQMLKGAKAPLWLAVGRWMASVDLPMQQKLFKSLVLDDERALYDDYFDVDRRERDLVTRLAYLYQHTYLVNDILVKSDRASMMSSLEVRPPLLDPRLVEFANRLPLKHKMRGLDTKVILKSLLKDRYGAPAEICARGKKGFAVPVAEWLRGPLKTFASKYFSREFLRAQGVFNEAAVSALFEEHLSGRQNHRKPLWTLLCYQVWWEQNRPTLDSTKA